jgi:hypothetical protein
MGVGRRELLTGIAAVAVAGVIPALPTSASVLDRRSVVLGSLWQYHEAKTSRIIIRHVPTGLTFQRRATEADRYAVAPVGIQPTIDAATIATIGSAARFVSLQALLISSCRPEHKGAIYFRYRPDADPDDPYYHPITEDAPPLTWVET